jgi:aminopeptidase N
MALLSAACAADAPSPEPGVARSLANSRRETIGDVRYEASFTIPEALTEPVTGRVTLRFAHRGNSAIVLDFDTQNGSVRSVTSGGRAVEYDTPPGHIVVSASELASANYKTSSPGGTGNDATEREITVGFVSSDGALNRQPEFLYSLFVPDRASTAFPCFNQPNIKARYQLSLVLPKRWLAVANGALTRSDSSGATTSYEFAETQPISTYLFAFAAGRFSVEKAVRDGRTFHMYHRETDSAKVARNAPEIFDLEAAALKWLEDYTGIQYPFDKFDFVAIPAFQFGGMEHPGAILYRAAGLLLDEAPTTNQLLGRASLIAHETAHMWFGDLVTMDWFSDVWMKEVFANFMAAKIVAPSFPQINHELRFNLAHHPAAYEIDRTSGANPIQQELDNLREAGSLYGAIIYQKAPVVMKQLESLIGEEKLRDGLRQYLHRFSFGSASWDDLIGILDSSSDEDLASWSHVWVRTAGRPRIAASYSADGSGRLAALQVTQRRDDIRSETAAHSGPPVLWNQRLDVILGYGSNLRRVPVHLRGDSVISYDVAGWPRPDFVLPGADGVAYGHFALDSASLQYLIAHISDLAEPVVRSGAWLALWEALLYGEVAPAQLMQRTIAAIPLERDDLILQHVLGILRSTYWRFLPVSLRDSLAGTVETMLWKEVDAAQSASRKRAAFDALVSVTLTRDGTDRLERIWKKDETVPGLPFADDQYIELAKALAIRDHSDADAILSEQLERITNADRKARFAFVMPALSGRQQVRDSVFASFADLANRRQEAWVLEAQAALHHPLRSAASLKYVEPSLGLVEEIQRTGDIFFPLRWLNATLDGHRSPEAAGVVRKFLESHPNYPPRLRAKIEQAADELNRVGYGVWGMGYRGLAH